MTAQRPSRANASRRPRKLVQWQHEGKERDPPAQPPRPCPPPHLPRKPPPRAQDRRRAGLPRAGGAGAQVPAGGLAVARLRRDRRAQQHAPAPAPPAAGRRGGGAGRGPPGARARGRGGRQAAVLPRDPLARAADPGGRAAGRAELRRLPRLRGVARGRPGGAAAVARPRRPRRGGAAGGFGQPQAGAGLRPGVGAHRAPLRGGPPPGDPPALPRRRPRGRPGRLRAVQARAARRAGRRAAARDAGARAAGRARHRAAGRRPQAPGRRAPRRRAAPAGAGGARARVGDDGGGLGRGEIHLPGRGTRGGQVAPGYRLPRQQGPLRAPRDPPRRREDPLLHQQPLRPDHAGPVPRLLPPGVGAPDPRPLAPRARRGPTRLRPRPADALLRGRGPRLRPDRRPRRGGLRR
ncbi:hypothetical protein Mterra_03275 [Calidithermus terrae]|uniref:Uncharacterized protein n=1 Tax=Calidithermus terrae TaxID=1408545 RepID=A0A399ECN7_9DEIN|nr:hypothetical protein Mterra_03275 [Calidithermus terrae]